MKRNIYAYFDSTGTKFAKHDNLSEVVSTQDNFDALLIPKDHPARSQSDTYYIDNTTVLRTHTTAHQHALLSSGARDFLVTGDVYRKDEVNKTHYPVFHQMEGVTKVPPGMDASKFLTELMTALAQWLFPGTSCRMNDDSFPFTTPSYEMEVWFNGQWLEVLGCGVVHPDILARHNITENLVAWGLGLERLCMVLYDIPDIRLFWTEDPRFVKQFTCGACKFVPYCRFQPAYRDLSMWIPADDVQEDTMHWKHTNAFCEKVRELSADVVRSVDLYDKFFHPKRQRYSHTFRLEYDPVDADIVATPKDLACLATQTTALLGAWATEHLGVEIR
ncbi:Phenylalanine--tRNA ligase [Chlorella vulgaris]